MEQPVRTSVSHVLRIDEVAVPAARGKIGMTLFPGRRDRISAFGAWQRDLDADLEIVRRWNPAMIVSLVEPAEYAVNGVPQYPKVMRAFATAHAVAWVEAPIHDGGVPDARFEAAWVETGRAARLALRDGRNVLFHCRAGLGRTGMMAARLLVECGVSPPDAMAMVRNARANTIEPGRQERHVLGSKPLAT